MSPESSALQEEDVVGEEIGVDHARRAVRSATPASGTSSSVADQRARAPAPRHRRGRSRHREERPPAVDATERWRGACAKSRPGRVHRGERLPELPRNDATCGRRTHMPSRNEMIAAGRPASAAQRRRRRAPRPAAGRRCRVRGKMLHQPEEERQVGLRHPLLVERQDEGAGLRPEQEVGVLDALRDALEARAAGRDRRPSGRSSRSASATSV